MSWIKVIPYENADQVLKKVYKRVAGPGNIIDNVLSIHSLRPHTLTGHMALYKNVLHNRNNTLPKWYLELLGVYVSFLNKCDYCVDHHFAGLQRLVADDDKSNKLLQAVKANVFNNVISDQYLAGINYARVLTLNHTSINKESIETLRKAGFTDGEILEINQVISYFNYVNRTVVGLGVSTEGDILGLSPSDNDDQNNWSHQ